MPCGREIELMWLLGVVKYDKFWIPCFEDQWLIDHVGMCLFENMGNGFTWCMCIDKKILLTYRVC